MSDFHTVTTRTARKPARCCETGARINSGNKYVSFTGCYEGDFYSEKMKPVIAEMYQRLNKESWDNGDDGIQFGSLYECVFESLRNPTPERIADAKAYIAERDTVPDWMHEAIKEAEDASA